MLETREPRPLGGSLIAEFSAFLATRIGLHFPAERSGDLERGLAAAAHELGFRDAPSCMRAMLAAALSRSQLETLASHLTVGETYFFRERQSFECLERDVLPQLVQSRRARERRLRVWSAGCSSGEEPYSIAIALTRALPDLRDWNVSILATDINPRALRRASLGIYGAWSFRDTPTGVREQFFTSTKDGRYQIAERIRSMVSFGYLNLAEDSYPSVDTGTNAMDIVFCRNVLMYFEPAHAARALEKLGRSLMDEGWLFVNPVEISRSAPPQLATVNLPGAIVYRKGAMPVRPAEEAGTLPVSIPNAPGTQGAVELPAWAAPGEAPTLSPRDFAREPTQCEAAVPTPHEQAATLYALGRYAEAAKVLNRAVAREPGDVGAMVLLARCHANQGDLAEAADWCRKVLAADKLNPAWHYLLATIAQEQGEVDAATAALRRALYLDPEHALAHFALGNLVRRQGKHQDCERHYRNALAVLAQYAEGQSLPEAEGITAGRLAEIIRSSFASEVRE